MFTELHSTRRRGAPALRDAAGQLIEIRRLLAKWECAASPLGYSFGDPPARDHGAEALRELYEPRELSARLDWAKRLAGDTKEIVISQLKQAHSLGPLRRVALRPDPADIDALEQNFPHLRSVVDQLRRRVALANRSTPQAFRLPPLLLSGPPGAGKTAFAGRLAAALKSRVINIDMASLETPFSIVGLDVGYATGRPGAVWEAMQHESMTPVIVLDELDKARQGVGDRDVTGFLYSLLEPLTATRFVDAAIGLAIDVSRVIWIATCNDASQIHPAIRSRFKLVAVDLPTRQQMPAVIRSIHAELLRGAEWRGGFEHDLDDDVLSELLSMPPRSVWHALEEAYATCALAGRRRLVPSDIPTVTRDTTRTRPIGFIHNDNDPYRI